MPVFGLPIFIMPNILLPTFMLEGNAVLNESLYNNGGRLHNHRFKALVYMLAKDDKITANTLINDNLEFPYSEAKYIVGGFFMKYLYEQYGLSKVNQFFLHHSKHYINPLLFATSFKEYFKIPFDTMLQRFVIDFLSKNQDFKPLLATTTKQHHSSFAIATSKKEIYLSKFGKSVEFLTTNLKNRPTLNILKDGKITTKRCKFIGDKLFRYQNNRLIRDNHFISSTQIKFGLFDESRVINKQTIDKFILDIQDNDMLYIDINSSFSRAKLYLNGKYYDTIDSSSALFDDNKNIYYFKQIGNKRVLFRNKQEILRFDGYSSKIVDIVGDSIYFLSNKLYRYTNGVIERLPYDNIIDAKIVDDKVVLVSIGSTNYSVSIEDIANFSIAKIEDFDRIKTTTKFRFDTDISDQTIKSKPYSEYSNLEFSYLEPYYYGKSDSGQTLYGVSALFIDPVLYNYLNLYAYRDEDDEVASILYANERDIPYSIRASHIDKTIKTQDELDYSVALNIYGALYTKGRDVFDLDLKFYQSDDHKDKKVSVASGAYRYTEKYPLEDNYELFYQAEFLYRNDRDYNNFGLDLSVESNIFDLFNVGIYGRKIGSDIDILSEQKGLKVVNKPIDLSEDKTHTLIEGVDNNFYIKDIESFKAQISKTIYLPLYFESFPISLRKENIFVSTARYSVGLNNKEFDIDEDIIGCKLDLLIAHKLSLPIIIKYIKNSASRNETQTVVELGIQF